MNASPSMIAEGGEEALRAWWMPFTHNRYFKAHPRLIASASGAYYSLVDGRRVFDGLSGLWCCPLGHSPAGVVKAVQEQVATLDFAPSFQMGHPAAFSLASRLVKLAGRPRDRVFFVNSGSEAVDTALKVAVAYHRARGEASRTRIIGRERAYHGVGMGGISVGGIPANRKMFAPLMIPGVDHLPHTFDMSKMGYSRGQPDWGLHLADELERIVALHDASNIAAVIVEPMQGSTGVIVPPKGYLARLREICSKHGILLIFDEVITGFGRTGNWFGSQTFGIKPHIMTIAKGLSSGYVPIGGSIVCDEVAKVVGENGDFNHGYTYSAHPVAAAVALENLRIIQEEKLIERVQDDIGPYLAKRWAELADHPLVGEARTVGMMGTLALTPETGTRKPFASPEGTVGYRCRERCFANDLVMRHVGDRMIISPPLIFSHDDVDELVKRARKSLDECYAGLKADDLLKAA